MESSGARDEPHFASGEKSCDVQVQIQIQEYWDTHIFSTAMSIVESMIFDQSKASAAEKCQVERFVMHDIKMHFILL